MSDTVSNAGSTGTTSTDISSAIDQMTAAFNQAIQTNIQITTTKTELGAEESAAQQRPNIG
jgi:hypothetical protein